MAYLLLNVMEMIAEIERLKEELENIKERDSKEVRLDTSK